MIEKKNYNVDDNYVSSKDTPPAYQMEGNVVLITGGGGGIARGIARAFAVEHCNLVLTDLSEERMEATKKVLVDDFGVDVLCIKCDGYNEEDVENAIQKTIERYGRLDTVINNAQASASGLTLVQHTKENFDLAIHSGLYATFFFMKHAYPYLKEAQGSVINFASGAGINGRAGQSSYAAAKEGIRGLSRCAATEWGPDNIRCNVVCPIVYTDALDTWRISHEDLFQQTLAGIPLGHYGDAEKDVGRVCVFLASSAARYITGETISIQGGKSLRP